MNIPKHTTVTHSLLPDSISIFTVTITASLESCLVVGVVYPPASHGSDRSGSQCKRKIEYVKCQQGIRHKRRHRDHCDDGSFGESCLLSSWYGEHRLVEHWILEATVQCLGNVLNRNMVVRVPV